MPEEKIPLVVWYNFDSEVPVYLFDTEDEARAELKRQFEEELRIQTEENGHVLGQDLKVITEPFYSFASITIERYGGDKDVIEWSIGTIKPIPRS